MNTAIEATYNINAVPHSGPVRHSCAQLFLIQLFFCRTRWSSHWLFLLHRCSNGHINSIISSLIGLADELPGKRFLVLTFLLLGWIIMRRIYSAGRWTGETERENGRRDGEKKTAKKRKGFPSLYTSDENLLSIHWIAYKIGPRSRL